MEIAIASYSYRSGLIRNIIAFYSYCSESMTKTITYNAVTFWSNVADLWKLEDWWIEEWIDELRIGNSISLAVFIVNLPDLTKIVLYLNVRWPIWGSNQTPWWKMNSQSRTAGERVNIFCTLLWQTLYDICIYVPLYVCKCIPISRKSISHGVCS